MKDPIPWKEFLAPIMKDTDPLLICITIIVGAVTVVFSFCLICVCKRSSKTKKRTEVNPEKINRIHCGCRRSNENFATVTRSTSSATVGSKYNEWREPVFETALGDRCISEYFTEKGLHVDHTDWEDSCRIMGNVIRVIAREMKKAANIRFPGLVLDETFIKQGSSREGLKICDPLEFDFIIPFRVDGLKTKKEEVFDRYRNVLPGLFKEKIINTFKVQPWMRKNSILEDDFEGTYINTNNFQKKVFTSLLDESIDEINKQLKRMSTWNENYRIVRSVYPPNLKITIQVNSQIGLKRLATTVTVLESKNEGVNVTYLEADLVPALCLSSDTVPDPYTVHDFHQCLHYHPTSYTDRQMPCERYGIMKWANESNQFISANNRDILWRNSTCGYEKHILDVARRNQSQRYILTACRLLKGALQNFNRKSLGESQLDSVVKSYHLKHICLYCILFLTIPSKEKQLSGVKEALGYFIKYLQLSINAEVLPHFFYGNPYIEVMFPWSSFEEETYNLFSFKDPQTLRQARLILPEFLQTLIMSGLYYEEWKLDSEKVKLFEDLLEKHD